MKLNLSVILILIMGIMSCKESDELSKNDSTSALFEWIKIEPFTLKTIGEKKFFVKESCDGINIDFKSVQSYFFMQAFKKYHNAPINEMDRKFYFDGALATFDKGVFDEEE